MKIFRGNSAIQGNLKLLKNPDKKYIFNTVENFTATLFFRERCKIFSMQYIQAVKAITVKFLVRENATRKELHPLELTSKVTTECAYNGTSRGLYCIKNVIAELKI